jgi:hypothetical protein
MALGVSTFMGTSAALATPVNVSGTVGTCTVASSVSASPVTFGTVKRNEIGTANLSVTITEGKTAACVDTDSIVSASIGDFTDEALSDRGVKQVIVAIEPLVGTSFPMTATVPAGAALGNFGATVTLTLTNNG